MRKYIILVLSAALISLASSAETLVKLPKKLGLIEPDIPIDTPLTKEKIELGRIIFFDSRLSGSGHTSCATCHNPANSFGDPQERSKQDNGLTTIRHAPSILNSGFLPTAMWDGRFRTLEAQVLDAFRRNGDMGLDVEQVVSFLRSDSNYRRLFYSSFKSEPSADNMAVAVAQFERSMTSANSRFDRFLFGGDSNAISHEEKKGLAIFSSKGGCLNCHDVFHPAFNPLGGGLALFTDYRFHNLGIGYSNGKFSDMGRYLITRESQDVGAFRTPSLRNLGKRSAFMHDGSLRTLDEVVEFYNRGGNQNPFISPSIHALYLTKEEKDFLVKFLRTLDSE